VLLLLCLLPYTEAKGQAYGDRAIGSRAINKRGFFFFPIYGRTTYTTPDGHHYSPSYGGWSRAGGWHAVNNLTGNATCGDGDFVCPCPEPNENATRKWVWVQMLTTKRMCALCGGADEFHPEYANGTDSVSFEVDAFMEIASRVPCMPPTTVLALKICSLSDWNLVDGGLEDDQLSDSAVCETVGADTASLPSRRRLLSTAPGPAPYYVVQFVVGATSEGHGNFLHAAIQDALLNDSSRLREVYNISGVLSMETEGSYFWTGGVIFGIAVASCCGLCILCALCACLINWCFELCESCKSARDERKALVADSDSDDIAE